MIQATNGHDNDKGENQTEKTAQLPNVTTGQVDIELGSATSEFERRVIRKIDMFLVPAMVAGYGLVYYDKAILGSAALFGMTTDLQLSVTDPRDISAKPDTSRLSWATSIFYIGQLVGSYPMTFILQWYHTQYVLGLVVVAWGIICAATAGVTTWQGLLVQRFCLGFSESIVPSAFMIIISGYYTQSEQALRQSWWFSGTGWFTIIGGALNYGMVQINGGILAPWQYTYVLAGGLTCLFGIWCFFLPMSPQHAWFLSPEERAVATRRLPERMTNCPNKTVKAAQIREAALDINIWLVTVVMAAVFTTNGAVTGFGPIIVSTLGYSSLESILLQFPLAAIAIVGILSTGWVCSRYRRTRVIMLILCCLPVVAGSVIIWKSEWRYHSVTPVVGYTLIGFFGPAASLTISLAAGNVAGETKKSFTASAVFVAYCVGNIVGPQLVRSDRKRLHYPELWSGLIVCYCIAILCACILYARWSRENKRRDQLGLDDTVRSVRSAQDPTDKANLRFRYAL